MKKKKIILDCGAHLGESVKKFRSILPEDDLEFHMFEPNTFLFDIFNSSPEFDNCFKYNKAVTNKVGKMKLYGCVKNKLSVGSTLEKSKADWDKISEDDYIEIDGLDITEFIRLLPEESYIILKLDVEGSEYGILEKLLETGIIHRVNELFCEFHTGWLDPSFKGREQSIRQKLNEINRTVTYWDALN